MNITVKELILTAKFYYLKPLSANLTKWSNTLEQFVGNLTTNCLSVFDYFVKLALGGLRVDIFAKQCSCFAGPKTANLAEHIFVTAFLL